MRKLVVAVVALFMFQFVLVSCEAEDQEFNENVKQEQVKNKTLSVVPGNAGGEDDDDEEDGS